MIIVMITILAASRSLTGSVFKDGKYWTVRRGLRGKHLRMKVIDCAY